MDAEASYEHLRPPEDEGYFCDRLCVVATVLHRLDEEGLNPLKGFLGTVDFIGSVFNPHGHRDSRLQSWLTHFALLLKYEDDKRVWLLQRHNYGVDYYPTDVPADALTMGARVRYARDGPTGIVCNVATADDHWVGDRSWGDVVRRWNVWDRVDEERGRPYDFWGKNCQHLAYDVHKYTLEHAHVSAHGFEQYTEACQERLVSAERA
tara:strand:+ start:31 stop:651 length:621 start_codon:yes stop_codon:yes gene_type:complete